MDLHEYKELLADYIQRQIEANVKHIELTAETANDQTLLYEGANAALEELASQFLDDDMSYNT